MERPFLRARLALVILPEFSALVFPEPRACRVTMAAAGVHAPASTVKSGDLVCLLSQEEEEDCFISVSGSTEDKCSAKTIKDKGM
jgi:hypothetical protein